MTDKQELDPSTTFIPMYHPSFANSATTVTIAAFEQVWESKGWVAGLQPLEGNPEVTSPEPAPTPRSKPSSKNPEED
jgi:hypothetical protein